MENSVIELLKSVTLEKSNCPPLVFEQGTLIKVVMHTPNGLLVADDSDFNFIISAQDENKVWREI